MNCDNYRPLLIEVSRAMSPPLHEEPQLAMHLESCAGCREFFDSQVALTSACRALAETNAPAAVPPFLETRLLAQFDSMSRRRADRWWSRPVFAGFAACLMIAIVIARSPAPSLDPLNLVDDRPFIEIPYVPPLAPYERTEIKRMDVPIATLMAAGLKVRTGEPVGAVAADVIVGQDGLFHAVRIAPGTNAILD